MDDHISKLPNDLLVKILLRISTKEVVKTSVLSKRWSDVWKETSNLCLDMRIFANKRTLLSDETHQAAETVTKVINNHRSHLKSCIIYHYSYQYEDGMFKTWIQSLVNVKHVNHLSLVNFLIPNTKYNVTLHLPPNSFSHPNLISLLLGQYNLQASHAFIHCCNLKTLKLVDISADIKVFNEVLESCTSLQVLVLHINCNDSNAFLKIDNRNLKYLYLSCSDIGGIEVSSPNLDIFSIGTLLCDFEKVFIANRALQFNRNYWAIGKYFPHTSYNISCSHQEEINMGHEFMKNNYSMKKFASISVSIDLMNTKEFAMFKEVLAAWPGEMGELEIVFKNNNGSKKKEVDSSISTFHKKFWEESKPFTNVDFHAYTVWLYNFSGSDEEFVLVSRFITQGMVIRTMMIKPSSMSSSKMCEIETTIAKLKELPRSHKDLNIFMF
ncbi:unnamed protein product [Cochlearia groenlandica]